MTADVGVRNTRPASHKICKLRLVLSVTLLALVMTVGGNPKAASPLSIGSYASVSCLALNVRDQPGGASIAKLPAEWIVRIKSEPVHAMLGSAPLVWYEIESATSATSITGWAVGDYLTEIDSTSLRGGMTPLDVVNAQGALAHARQRGVEKIGSTEWYNPSTRMTYCLGFVADMYGVSGSLGWTCPGDEQYSCPNGGLALLRSTGSFHEAGISWNPPEGALIFFSGPPFKGVEYGHIGIHLGKSRVAHVTPTGPVANDFIADAAALIGGEYLGWAFPPIGWLDQNTESCSLTGTWIGETTYERVVREIDDDESEIERSTGMGGIELRMDTSGGTLAGEFRLVLDGEEGFWMPFSQEEGNLIDHGGCSFSIEVVIETSQSHSVGLFPVVMQMKATHSFAFYYDSETLLVEGLSLVNVDFISAAETVDDLSVMTISFPGLVLERSRSSQ